MDITLSTCPSIPRREPMSQKTNQCKQFHRTLHGTHVPWQKRCIHQKTDQALWRQKLTKYSIRCIKSTTCIISPLFSLQTAKCFPSGLNLTAFTFLLNLYLWTIVWDMRLIICASPSSLIAINTQPFGLISKAV